MRSSLYSYVILFGVFGSCSAATAWRIVLNVDGFALFRPIPRPAPRPTSKATTPTRIGTQTGVPPVPDVVGVAGVVVVVVLLVVVGVVATTPGFTVKTNAP